MLTKNQLKEIFIRYDFRPLKRLGENYLIDGNIKDKIISAARLKSDDIVLEIGPGFGALTFDLAKSGAKIFAVEKDKKAFDILKEITAGEHPNLEIYNEDILKFEIKKLFKGKKIKVVGNLPYYITSPIIEHLIMNMDVIVSIIMTVQKEAAQRILAGPGTKNYGSLSCFVQYYAKSEYIYTIKRTSFFPVPDVDSALMRLDLRSAPPVAAGDEGLFFRIVRGAFNQRRKSVINSLSRPEVLGISKEKLAAILRDAGIDPSSRPETLSLSDFALISNALTT